MPLPTQPVTLTPEQIAELNQKLSAMRHGINNNLAIIMSAAELARMSPERAHDMLGRLLEQPGKITEQIRLFSDEFERLFGITRR
ncbi:MAG: hypothetical protein ACK45B_10280 [Limisphaerales bacterium]